MHSTQPNLMKAISPEQAHQLQADGARLIDVRSLDERRAGFAQGSLKLTIDEIAENPSALGAPNAEALVFICQKDPRSQRAAAIAEEAGFADVSYVVGGSEAWKASGLPWMVEDKFFERYARHLSLAEVGLEGQRKLQNATVAMLGAGGLGSPIAYYLAAAGVGRLKIIDHDTIDRTNLQRQILHTDARVGELKVESARETLLALNPDIQVDAINAKLTRENVDAFIADADLVIDGADNFAARHLINDACYRLRKPWVYAALQQFDGHVSVFDLRDPSAGLPCYRCLFPEAPDASFAPNCSEAGVLGVLPGLVGMIQATEAVKWILGIGEPLVGQLLQVDALGMNFRKLRLRKDPQCPQCGERSGR